MKVRSQLFLLSAAFLALSAAIGFITFQAFREISAETGDNHDVNQLLKDVHGLDIATYEFVMHHEARMARQWKARYDSVGKQLEEMKEAEGHPERLRSLALMTSDHKALRDSLSQLQANFAKRKKLIVERRPRAEIDPSLALEERIVAQVVMRSERITSEAMKLSAMAEQAIGRTQRRANLSILFSIAGVIVISFCISLFVVRSITGPIAKLAKGAEIIGKGNLGHRVEIKGENEIAKLGATFNEMAGNVERTLTTLDAAVVERKQAEDEVRKLNEELEERVRQRTVQLAAANQELEAFAYSVSHDLRAPLRGIDGFSQVLLEDYAGALDEQGKGYLHRVRAAAQRMGKLIEDLLGLSRTARKEMRRTQVDLSALARAVATELKESDPEREVLFSIQGDVVADGDEQLLRAVLANLFGNAWKFTGKRTEARVEFGVVEHNGGTAYFVKDNGAGFDMAYADKLFGAFQRLHSQEEFRGTGIGLATVHRIVRRHGGSVWAEAEVEEGATFYFTLG